MRAAAILGLGSNEKDLKPFQKNSDATWLIGLPTTADDADVILIFGGDGTVHRHLSQLVKLQRPVLVVPCGSGNDFARALSLRGIRDSLTAWQQFASGAKNVRTIDLGLIIPLEPAARGVPAPQLNYFCCVAGVGLDGEVARRANRLPRWLRGHGGYVLSLAPALLRFNSVRTRIDVPKDSQHAEFMTRIDTPAILAAFANAPSYGGGMKIAPHAQLDDGQLDVCLISDINKLRLLGVLPSVYFGRHLNMSEVEYFQAQRLRVTTEQPLDVYADGEYVCSTPVEVSVVPAAFQVVVRKPKTES